MSAIATTTAAADATAPTITIHIKTMVGDIISISIPVRATAYDVYGLVHRALPDDIRPLYDYSLSLFKEEEEEEEEEEKKNPVIHHDVNPFPAEDGDVFYVLIQPSCYEMYIDCIGEAVDASNKRYDRCRLQVICDGLDTVNMVTFYATATARATARATTGTTTVFYRARDVIISPGTQWQEDERILLPANVAPMRPEDLFFCSEIPDHVRERLQEEFLPEWERTAQEWYQEQYDDHDEPEYDDIN